MIKKKVLVWETLATISGGQKMTLTILDMLKDNYEVCCLIPAEGILSKELESKNIKYILMGDQTLPTGIKGKQAIFRYAWMSLKNIYRSLKVICTYKPDILYAPGPAALPWSAICGTLSQKPVIWHLHHVFLDEPTKKLLNFFGKWKSVKKIIAVSNCVGNQIQNEIALPKIEVLYNPVNVKKYVNGNADNVLTEIENALGRKIFRETSVLGHIALIQNSKKQAFTLEVIKALREKGYDVIGVFAGECRDAEYMEELIQKVNQYELTGQVVFLGRRGDIQDLIKMLNVLIIPSAFEGFPLVGLEAASAGVPVIACDVAGAEEFIRVSGAGACFIEGNVEEAAKAAIHCLNESLSYSAKAQTFAQKCTETKYRQKMLDVFELSDK